MLLCLLSTGTSCHAQSKQSRVAAQSASLFSNARFYARKVGNGEAMDNKIIKPDIQSGVVLNKGKLRSSTTPFQQRVNSAKQNEIDPSTMPNRICLMLDKSSSMSTVEKHDKKRIDLLKEALQNFIARCDLNNTAIAIETFPEGFALAMTNSALTLSTAAFMIEAGGNTPMRHCVEACLTIPMTRAVIVSDGEATDWHRWEPDDEPSRAADAGSSALLSKYKEAGIPIDCVHIATDTGGEELLRKIASATGGIFIKFTDVSAFASAFGYLAPGYRAMLTDGRISASQLGAEEVRNV
jgi:Mg-chelatase subunit ChlD